MKGKGSGGLVRGGAGRRVKGETNRQACRARARQDRRGGRAAMEDTDRLMMRPGGSAGRAGTAAGQLGAERRAGGIEGGGGCRTGQEGLKHQRIDGEAGKSQPQKSPQMACPVTHPNVRTLKRAGVKMARDPSARGRNMAGLEACTAAWAEARARVFGGGFDRSFRIVLALAYLGGALFLAQSSGGLAPVSILTGLASMTLFLMMPLVVIFTYVLGLSFLAAVSGLDGEADPPMHTVFAAFIFALICGAGFIGGTFALPLVGAQLRLIFS
jgi:hypothetical protein